MITNRPSMPRLLAATAIGAVALLGAAAPVAAQSYVSGGTATFSDATPAPGETLTISGATQPNVLVVVTLTGSGGGLRGQASQVTSATLGSTTSDATGRYSLTVSIPSNLARGSYTLAVTAGSTVLSSTLISVAGVVPVQVTPTQTPGAAAQLPVTGSNSNVIVYSGLGLFAVGAGALIASKRRPEDLDSISD